MARALARAEGRLRFGRGLLLCAGLGLGALPFGAAGTARAQEAGSDTAAMVAAFEKMPKRPKVRAIVGVETCGTRSLIIAPCTDTGVASDETEVLVQPPKEYQPVDPAIAIGLRIQFDLDSAVLRPDGAARLSGVCEAMKLADVEKFQVIGHTDTRGTETYNLVLSRLRAVAVTRYLEEDCGIAAERLEAVGVGEAYPYDASHPRDAVNRRVEFQALY
jgi:OmpA-OmpF porin, OOP family